MITIDILTKNGQLIKLQPEEAEDVFVALKKLFEKSSYYYQAVPQAFPRCHGGPTGSILTNGAC